MQELRLVAVSEDGSYAVLAVPGRGGRFSLPIDDRLRIVARGQFSRLAQYEIEVESPLRPKEIQDRIRAGETADEIADAAGVPIERVRRFEGPVLAERAYRAQEAQRATIRRPGDSGPGPRLGDIVTERLVTFGASPEDALWDSRKRADGNWQVQLMFSAGGRPHMAEWVFDPRRMHAMPADDDAARLSLPEEDMPVPQRSGGTGGHATVTPIATRLAPLGPAATLGLGPLTQHDPEPEHRHVAQARAASRDTRLDNSPRTASLDNSPRTASVDNSPRTASVDNSPRTASLDNPPRTASPDTPARTASLDNSPRTASPDTPARTASLDNLPRTASPDAAPSSVGADGAAEDDDAAQAPPPARERPAKKAAGGRSRRSSVPSWDEIMLGNSRQPD
jgi:Protein of unknown function (DUF3071)